MAVRMSTRTLILAAVMGLVMTACSKKSSTPDETATPVGDPAPAAPASERPRLTGAECEAKSGVVVGDIGDGAVHRPDYKCADGQAPIASIRPAEGEPVAIEGSVCCPPPA